MMKRSRTGWSRGTLPCRRTPNTRLERQSRHIHPVPVEGPGDASTVHGAQGGQRRRELDAETLATNVDFRTAPGLSHITPPACLLLLLSPIPLDI
jgi:hypothetical protein